MTPQVPSTSQCADEGGVVEEDEEAVIRETVQNLVDVSCAIAESSIHAEVQSSSMQTASQNASRANVVDNEFASLAPGERIHHVKWTNSPLAGGPRVPIVTQNENGPCPLLAIVNILLLRGQMHLDTNSEVVSSQYLLDRLFDCVLRLRPKNLAQGEEAHYERNLNDALGELQRLMTGIDVNVKFNSCDSFESTPDVLIFDLLDMPLYHGWVVDPKEEQTAHVLGEKSYNTLVEFIINARHSETANEESELNSVQAEIADAFINEHATQLTHYGIVALKKKMKEQELAVFFRNNHFSTLHKHKDQLYLLVTDAGFLHEKNIVWETLTDITGDSIFVDAEFKAVPAKTEAQAAETSTQAQTLQFDRKTQEQLDYELALALERGEHDVPMTSNSVSSADATTTTTIATQMRSSYAVVAHPDFAPNTTDSDEQLARRFQEEEYRRHEEAMAAARRTQQQPLQAHSPRASLASGNDRQTHGDAVVVKDEKKNCVLM